MNNIDNKELRQQVYDAISRAGMRHYRESKENVLEKGKIFTRANKNVELIEILKDIEGLNLSADKFCGFSNGILFTIKKSMY